MFSFITWDVNPDIFSHIITLRYYSLLFAVSFILGYWLIGKMFANEKAPSEWVEKILIYGVLGTIIGARLGHVFFYQWDYYQDHLLEIVQVWKGGLASHGAAIALVIAMWIYSRKITKKSVLWSLDKLVVAVAVAACFIRIGNLMNSEIIGAKSNCENAFFFAFPAKQDIAARFGAKADNVTIEKTNESINLNGFDYPIANIKVLSSDHLDFHRAFDYFSQTTAFARVDNETHYFSINNTPEIIEVKGTTSIRAKIGLIPRIPTQIIEAFSYLIIFLILIFAYWKLHWYRRSGLLFGTFLFLLFGARFVVEFWKEHQALNDDALLNMGQLLSIPAIVVGAVFMARAFYLPVQDEEKQD